MEISVFDKCPNCYGQGVRGGSEIGTVDDCLSCKGTGNIPSELGLDVLRLVQLFKDDRP